MSPLAWALLVAAPPLQAVPASSSSAERQEVAKLPEPARALGATHPRHARGDPLEGINRRFFALNAGLDHAIFRPLAMGYKHGVPRFARSGLRNFFSNLTEPIVFLNDLLQLKPGRAAKTLVRFVVNSTIGIGGLADPADLKSR